MKKHHLAIGLFLGTAVAIPATAQYGAAASSQPKAQPSAKASKEEAARQEAKKPKVSSDALKEIQALDKAVKAKDAANIPALVAAAKAKAKTADDRYVVGQLALSAAIDAQDKPGMINALQAIVDSGFGSPADYFPFHLNIGKLNMEAGNYAAAEAALKKAMALQPDNIDALTAMSDTADKLGRHAEAVEHLRKAIAIKTASGTKPDESWYRRATALAFNNKLPGFEAAAIEWVKAYPSKTSWSDALRIYQQAKGLDAGSAIDLARLNYAVGALKSENDYYRYASAAAAKGFPGEAKAVLEAGFTAGVLSKSHPTFGPLYASVSTKAQGDRASLTTAAKTAMAATTAKQAVTIGDAYYGYGQYADAIPLYRAALDKTGADKDLINLHLGMALARSGDKAGAKAALEAVGGSQAEIAKFWLAYVAN